MTATRFPQPPAIALAAFTLAASAVLQAADWPNYRGPNHDGVSQETLPAQPWKDSGPRELWRIPTPTGFSSFTIADGRAFSIIKREVDGADQEVVVALDAETGRELWGQALGAAKYQGGGDDGTPDNKGGDGPRSTPTVHAGKVYVLDIGFNLHCLEAASGKRVWKRNILGDHQGRSISWGNAASPVIEGNLVLVAGGGSGEALLGIDTTTGKTVWKGEDDRPTHATPVVATLLGVRQAIFFTQSGLVAVQPADGKVLWRQSFPHRISTAASPVIEGDIVYCSAGYGVGAGAYRISKAGTEFKATELWRQPGKLESHWSTPIVRDGHLYGLFGFKKYGSCPLKCVELATGKEKWSRDGFGPGNVTRAGNRLIVLGDAGQLVCVEADPAGYREIARADVLAGKCWSTPTLANGRIYARSTQEGVCLDLHSQVAAR